LFALHVIISDEVIVVPDNAPLKLPVVALNDELKLPVVPDNAPLKLPVVPDNAPLKLPDVPDNASPRVVTPVTLNVLLRYAVVLTVKDGVDTAPAVTVPENDPFPLESILQFSECPTTPPNPAAQQETEPNTSILESLVVVPGG